MTPLEPEQEYQSPSAENKGTFCILELRNMLSKIIKSLCILEPRSMWFLKTDLGRNKVAFNSFTMIPVEGDRAALTLLLEWSQVKWKSVSGSLRSHELYRPWNSPGQNTGVGSCSLLQGIFPTQGSNLGLSHCRQILYHLSHLGTAM